MKNFDPIGKLTKKGVEAFKMKTKKINLQHLLKGFYFQNQLASASQIS